MSSNIVEQMKLKQFNQRADELKEEYAKIIKSATALHEELQALRTEYDKDAEVAELKEEIARLEQEASLGFPITKEEHDAIRSWIDRHEILDHGWDTEEKRLRAQGCSGGRYTYIFLPTGIGTAGTIRCSCGAEFTFQELG